MAARALITGFGFSSRARALRATIFNQLQVIDFFLKTGAVVPQARAALLAHNVRIIAFFFPSAKRAALPREVFDSLRAEFCSLSKMSDVSFGPETLVDSVASEWLRFSVAPPPPVEQEIGQDEFRRWWEGVPYQRLRFVVLQLVGSTPTEASVERIFSKLKIAFNRLRSNLQDDGLQAQLVINSAIGVLFPPEKPGAPTPEWLPQKISPETVAWVLATIPRQAKQRVQARKRTRQTTSTCGVCNERFEDHAEEASVECDQCHRWFALACVGIAQHLRSHLAELDSWRCFSCTAKLDGQRNA